MIKGVLPKELEELFRRRVMEKYGHSKGAVSKALEAAIRLWLRYDYESTDEEESNNRAFESLINELESKYPGMYIVIEGGRMVSAHDSLDEALKIGDGEHKHRIIFKVGEKPFERLRLGWKASIKPVGHT